MRQAADANQRPVCKIKLVSNLDSITLVSWKASYFELFTLYFSSNFLVNSLEIKVHKNRTDRILIVTTKKLREKLSALLCKTRIFSRHSKNGRTSGRYLSLRAVSSGELTLRPLRREGKIKLSLCWIISHSSSPPAALTTTPYLSPFYRR